MRIVWHDGSDHKDSDRFPVVEFAGYIMMSFSDKHCGGSGSTSVGGLLLTVRWLFAQIINLSESEAYSHKSSLELTSSLRPRQFLAGNRSLQFKVVAIISYHYVALIVIS